ncbi:MAG: flagellar FliJ family protein [Candidatus Polarisedimenticolia bacterium]|nr:flagellar FliJ family protein [bacterium]
MARFLFRLRAPLRLARLRRTEGRKDLALALRDRTIAEDQLRSGLQRVETIGAEIVESVRGGVDGASLRAYAAARDAARARVPGLRDRALAAARAEDEVRERLKQIGREVQVLEKLRREAFERWLRDLARREQAMVDDVVLVRRARAMATEGRQ